MRIVNVCPTRIAKTVNYTEIALPQKTLRIIIATYCYTCMYIVEVCHVLHGLRTTSLHLQSGEGTNSLGSVIPLTTSKKLNGRKTRTDIHHIIYYRTCIYEEVVVH